MGQSRSSFGASNQGHRGASLAFSPDQRLLAIGTDGGAIELWDVTTFARAAPCVAGPSSPRTTAVDLLVACA